MKKKRSSLVNLLVFLILMSVCIILILSAWIVFSLPARAASLFGPANPDLAIQQHIYLSARLLLQEKELTQAESPNGEPQTFEIQLGETTPEITRRLQSQGILKNSQVFRDYLVYSGLDTSIQAGQYSLNPKMSPIEIAHALQDATPQNISFNILAGWRMEEIADALPTSGLSFAPGSFLAFAQNPVLSHPVLQYLPEGASLEGFFFPDQYRMDRDVTQEQFISTILDNFLVKITPTLLEGFKNQGLDLYQAVTLASIVQRESVAEDEMSTIASVFLNRLSMGMRLETDPTIQYALGYQNTAQSWWKNPLGLEDLKFDSLYNTYIYPGLPPGPIASPGIQALTAVAQPEQTPYFFFRASCDGSGRHNFSQTFEEHKANACP
jgi:UPF0755 protein